MQAPKFYYFDIGVANHLLHRKELVRGSADYDHAFEHLVIQEIYAWLQYTHSEEIVDYKIHKFPHPHIHTLKSIPALCLAPSETRPATQGRHRVRGWSKRINTITHSRIKKHSRILSPFYVGSLCLLCCLLIYILTN